MLRLSFKNENAVKIKKGKRKVEHVEYPELIMISTYIVEGYTETKEFEIELEIANLGFSPDDYEKLKQICKEVLIKEGYLTEEELVKGIRILKVKTK